MSPAFIKLSVGSRENDGWPKDSACIKSPHRSWPGCSESHLAPVIHQGSRPGSAVLVFCSIVSWLILTIAWNGQDLGKCKILPRKHSRFLASVAHSFYLIRNWSANEWCLFPSGKEALCGLTRNTSIHFLLTIIHCKEWQLVSESTDQLVGLS